jgi:hypothetical protein
MPAALYPKRRKITFATRTTTRSNPDHVKAYLLCRGCETKFNRNGESEVLRWVAAKALSKDAFPLLEKLKTAPVLRHEADLVAYSGSVVGIDTDKFAYFALSILWRAAVHQWTLPDGTVTVHLNLGAHEEPIRKFLIEETAFPAETAVVMTVCTDPTSREHWITPMFGREEGCMTFPFLTLGLILRVWIGFEIPKRIRWACCYSSPAKPIFAAHCDDETQKILASLPPM